VTSSRLLGQFLAGLSLGLVACGGDSLTIPPTSGTLEITTATSGSEPDADGYTLQVDTRQPQSIGAAETVQIPDLSPGAHNVLLSGLASNCSVEGTNPRTVTIAVGETTSEQFQLSCGATTGSLEVIAQTTGESQDADGYAINLDGSDRGPLGVNSSVTLTNLVPGSHVVGLASVAANCQVSGETLRAVTITSGATATITFAVGCVAPPPIVGVLRITTSTTGQDQDANGYTFTVDGGQSQPIGLNGATSLDQTAAGSHIVALSDVAGNCSVADGATKTATVTSGATTTLAFSITCAPIPPSVGAIRVTTTTTGDDRDDGYTLTLDGGGNQAIGANGAATLSNLVPGQHSVALSDVAANCAVSGEASRTVTVSAGGTINVDFSVACTALPPTVGTIRVTTATSGEDQDDGYTFKVDNGPNHAIGANEAVAVGNIPAGSHSVQLTGVAGNCAVDDDSKDVTVTAGATADVSFSITCTAIPPSASRSTVSVSRDNIDVITGTTTITVTVRDANGSVLPGVLVTPTASGTGNTFTPTSATTGQNGVASFTFSSTVAENKTITVTAGTVTLDDKPVVSVLRLTSTISITSDEPDPSTSGASIHVTFEVHVGGGTPTGTVDIFSLEEPGAGCTITDQQVDLTQGSCDFTLTAVGTHRLEAIYSGDTQFEESSAAGVNHVVDPVSPTP
jgi:hypothetical protein